MMTKKIGKRKSHINSGRTILVTGAAGDIGRVIAIRFAEEGWNVLCQYFSSATKAKKLKKMIETYDVECQLLQADFSSGTDIHHFIKKLSTFTIDTLVNNAGVYVSTKHFNKLTVDDITHVFMVNTIAPTLLSSYVFPLMKKRRFGRIVNISSIAAKYGGSSHSMHYGCSKRAIEGLTKTLSREGAEHNVFVNTIRPGVIDTQAHKKYQKNMKRRIAMVPAKKMGSPHDIADVVFHIGSDKNNFITNEVITIAGGE